MHVQVQLRAKLSAGMLYWTRAVLYILLEIEQALRDYLISSHPPLVDYLGRASQSCIRTLLRLFPNNFKTTPCGQHP